jgi:quercetin dioxygenase-like cupin family protein
MRKALVLIPIFATSLAVLPALGQSPAPQVILDNPSVRVTSVTFVPGSGTGRHQGIEAEVGIVVEGELTLDSPMGRRPLGGGTAYFLPGLMPHDTRNESSRPARLVEIFLKRCD